MDREKTGIDTETRLHLRLCCPTDPADCHGPNNSRSAGMRLLVPKDQLSLGHKTTTRCGKRLSVCIIYSMELIYKQ